MMATRPRDLDGPLERARRRFDRWRRTRRHGARIPNALWALAVAAAREHGINPTSEHLHLDFNHLKKRLEADSVTTVAARNEFPKRAEAPFPRATHPPKDSEFRFQGSARRRRRSLTKGATFVELAPAPAALPPCTIELENAQGAKMRIHLASPEGLDLAALIASLGKWKR